MNLTARVLLPMAILVVAIGFPCATAAQAVDVQVLSDSGDRIVLQYRVEGYRSTPVDIGDETFTRVSILGEASLQRKGAPELPQVSRSIVIPGDAQMTARVLSANYEEAPARIVPSKGILPRIIDPDRIPYEFGDAYGTDAFYPGPLVTLGDPYILRDHRGLVVQVYPLQYNAVTGMLRRYTDITIEVTAMGSGGANPLAGEPGVAHPSDAFVDLYRSHFLNFGAGPQSMFYNPLDEHGDMLIIANDAWIPNLNSFVTHKASMGIQATIVGISTIGNDPVKIKSYIQGVYDTSNLAFVLLVGDAAQVATNARQVGGESGACDVCYGKVAGADDYPDIMVGRFSALTAADVDTQVQRTITYETLPATAQDWYKRGIGIASDQGAGAGDEGQSDRQHIEEIRGWLLGAGYSLVDPIYDPGASAAQVSAAVNAGRGIINYCGHGSATSWGTTGFNVTNVDALVNDNMLPFIVSVACNNGEFHHYDKCFGEAWLRATNEATGAPTGAIGMYASSVSQSWAPPMEAADEFNIRLTDQATPYRDFGTLCFAGSSSMIDKYGASGVEMSDTWIVFGDPSVQILVPVGIEVTPSSGFTPAGPAGGPYAPQSIDYTLKNNEETPLDYQVTTTLPWISIANATGTIPVGGTAVVTVALGEGSRNYDNGTYGGVVRVINLTNHHGDQSRSVSLNVGGAIPVGRWTLDSDPGWARDGEWQFGPPTGGGGGRGFNPDPASAVTGSNIFGANLAGNIEKAPGSAYYLTAGPVDLSAVQSPVLRFQRYLNAPAAPDVRSTIDVSSGGTTWTGVWNNRAFLTDSAWSLQTVDISSVVEGSSAAYFRFGYQVVIRQNNAGSGWNLDDIEIVGRTTTARIALTVEPDGLSWTAVPASTGYDVVRGDIGTLVSTGGDFALATRECLGSRLAGTTLGYARAPVEGQGDWFLVRGVSLSGPMTYQSLAGRQVGSRDDGINAAAAACP